MEDDVVFASIVQSTRVHPERAPEGKVGEVVAPWADYYLEAVSRVLQGDVVRIPWDGLGTLARAPSG